MHFKANKIKYLATRKLKYNAINLGIDLIQLSKAWNDLLRLHQYSFLQLFEILVEELSAFFDIIANYFSNKHASIDGFGDNSPIGLEAFVSFLDHDSLRKIIIGDHKRRFSCSHPHDLATFADLRIWLNTFRLN